MDALYHARTRDEARAALDLADDWVDEHPDDFDVAMVMEGALMTLEAWDVMAQAALAGVQSDDHF